MLTINNTDELRNVLELLKPYCVTRIKLGDLELQIDPTLQAIKERESTQEEMPVEDRLQVTLKDLLAEQQADLEWST